MDSLKKLIKDRIKKNNNRIKRLNSVKDSLIPGFLRFINNVGESYTQNILKKIEKLEARNKELHDIMKKNDWS